MAENPVTRDTPEWDQEASARTFSDFHRLWVEPELRRRYGDAGPPSDFRIIECRVLLPAGKLPIVQFNDEVSWAATCKKPLGLAFAKGEPVYLHHIERIESVRAPTFEGAPVAFFYIHKVPGAGFRIIFDCTPAWEPARSQSPQEKWKFSDAVCEHLNAQLFERVIRFQETEKTALASIGVWAIPSLLPYPLSRCTQLVKEGKLQEARAEIVRYCSANWLESQLPRWLKMPELADRRSLLTQALAAHRAGQFVLSISSLVPHLEGIISDRMVRRLPAGEMNFRPGSKLGQFWDSALEGSDTPFAFRRVIESTMEFVLEGPVLETFKAWLDRTSDTFPNRHAVAHGKFIEGLYTEENSIKAFLLLDTLAHILAWTDGSWASGAQPVRMDDQSG